jgi:hypothetical protein
MGLMRLALLRDWSRFKRFDAVFINNTAQKNVYAQSDFSQNLFDDHS